MQLATAIRTQDEKATEAEAKVEGAGAGEDHYPTAYPRIQAKEDSTASGQTSRATARVVEVAEAVEAEVADEEVATETALPASLRQLHSSPTRTQQQYNHHLSPAVVASLVVA